ncbi:hypothetical protein BC332_24505 [Capsicum chinense]|nr:hypothetical protein BC332_24505 [Capsicum chinense]
MLSRLLGFCLNLNTLEDPKDVAENVKSFATDDPDEQRGVGVLHRWAKGSLVSLYGLGQSSSHELAFEVELGPRDEFCAFHEKVRSLEVFLKNFEKNKVSGEMTDLEVEIKEVANIVEQTIQLQVTEVILANDEKAQERLYDSLQQVAEDIDRIWKESAKIQDKGKQVSKESTVQEFPSSSKDIPTVENNMVGRDDQRKRLLEDLTRSYSNEPKVIPIVEMGGIGKTTLANEVYNHESILCHFDVHARATVSQQHNMKEILLSLLRSTIKMDDTVQMKGEAELACRKA